MSYKKICIAYENESKKNPGSKYLSIKNVSDEDVVIKPGESFFLNKTPQHIRDKYPTTPHYSKDIRVEDGEEKTQPPADQSLPSPEAVKVADDIPF